MRVVGQALRYSSGASLTLQFPEITSRSHEVVSCYLDMFIAQAARWRNVTLHLECLFRNLSLVKNRLPMPESFDLYLETFTGKLPFP